jgi:hypothetical protein
VINVLVKHSTHVFDGEPIPPNTEPTFAIDIEAGIDLKAALLERDLGYCHYDRELRTSNCGMPRSGSSLSNKCGSTCGGREIASPRPNLSGWHSRSTGASTYGSGVRRERL